MYQPLSFPWPKMPRAPRGFPEHGYDYAWLLCVRVFHSTVHILYRRQDSGEAQGIITLESMISTGMIFLSTRKARHSSEPTSAAVCSSV
jgi:hypothetical protein